jgi:hypothetical protein
MGTPKVMIYDGLTRKLISIRKFVEIDLIKDKDFILLQWGRDPIKFLCYVRKNKKPPTFLFSVRWNTVFCLGRIRFGSTTKPIDLSKFWRTTCAQVIDLDRCRHTAMTKGKTNCLIGSKTPTQE